jgi:tripartite-type tricarboxylate transporter receptor subunit TctC
MQLSKDLTPPPKSERLGSVAVQSWTLEAVSGFELSCSERLCRSVGQKKGTEMHKHMTRRGVLISSLLALPAAAQTTAMQAGWPRRPVKFIVPFAPGAGADVGARVAGDLLSAKWGQPVIVENRPGGDSLIAIRAIVNDNDDHQLLFSPSGNFTPHPYRHEKLGYTRETDLLPIARFSNTILAVGVSESLGVRTLKDLVAVARQRPRELNVVTVPGITEMVWDSFVKTEGVEITKVPYTNLVQGAGEMATGRVHVVMSALAIMQPVLQGKGARLLAVTSRIRTPLVPEVPTVIEAGVPSLEYEGLVGVFGPRSITDDLRRKVGGDIAEVAALPQVAARLAATGQVPNPGGADAFSADITRQEEQVAGIARVLGLKRNI